MVKLLISIVLGVIILAISFILINKYVITPIKKSKSFIESYPITSGMG